MEHVPAERAEASAEQQGKDLTERLNEPPTSIEGKAGEIEQKSPLFRGTEANPQRDMFRELLHGESGSFEPGKLAAPVSELFKQDVEPTLSKAGVGLRDTAALFIKALYPRIEESNPVGRWTRTAAPSDAVDALMKLKGDRARALSEFDAILSGIEKMFDKLPESTRVDFIDGLQTGKKQPTRELDGIASALRMIMDEQRRQEQIAANLGRSGPAIELSRKENYFHNWWNTPPGREPEADDDARVSRLFSPRRPLEGSKSYNKRQSYTLKTGIEAGGKPETTNPVHAEQSEAPGKLPRLDPRASWVFSLLVRRHDLGSPLVPVRVLWDCAPATVTAALFVCGVVVAEIVLITPFAGLGGLVGCIPALGFGLLACQYSGWKVFAEAGDSITA
jgi:hypothetical protein